MYKSRNLVERAINKLKLPASPPDTQPAMPVFNKLPRNHR
jgi:hypothetical protein